MAETTANERIRDALVRHQVELQRLGEGMSRKAVRLLDRTEDELVREIRDALARGATAESSVGLRKLQTLQDVVARIRLSALGDQAALLEDQMGELVRHEGEFAPRTIDVSSPVVLDLTVPSAKTLLSLVDEPFEGYTIKQWFDRVAAQDTNRIMDAVRVGLTRGLSIDDIVRSVVGSSALDGTDGVTAVTRNNVASLVRTAVNAYSNKARSLAFEANSDVLSFEVYTATLDARTSGICRSLDGKVYPVGEGKFPPQHFGCRSIRVALIGRDLAGSRPMKPTTERMLVQEFNDIEGTKAKLREDLERGFKGKFDEYARRRVRELIGTVPAKTTYQDWLKRQSASFQDEVLGKTKARLFRDGGLDLSRYVHRDGTELNLRQLARMNAAAFRKAGLDPSAYTAE